jgi:type I restriction enzyme S subunit
MNAERLLAHYEKIADASDAIARLRRFILDLAVRGKLVPQDANDEPASELLKRIAREKARLVKAGEIGTPKAIPALPEPPFAIPSNWHWSQLAEIGVLSPRNEAPDILEASFVPMPLIAAEYGVANQHEVRPWGEIKKGYTHFAEGDVGLAKITPCFENGKSSVFRNLTGRIGAGTTELHIVRPLFVDQDYILLFLKSPHFIETGIPKMTGTAGQKRVPTEYFAHSPFPLPPIAEQHRIVTKVDELMALCDRLEAAWTSREAVRDRLAAASLARLNTPDPETFEIDAGFFLNALPALTTRFDQIKSLRQTILNLAVRGKLVSQDPKDEPASELLKRVFALPWTKKRKPSDLEPDNDALADVFPLPRGWEWASVNALVRPNETVTYGILKPEWVADGVPTVRVTEMKTGTIDVVSLPKCDRARAAKFRKTTLAPGDLLVSKDGTIGKTAFVPPELAGGNITQHVLRFPICDLVNSQYIRLTIDAPFCQAWMAGETKGVALQGVNVGDFRRMPIPIPPLAEQHRIVAIVDALMALCDRLEASLTATAATRRRLLDALLAEALAPSDDREQEAAA